MTTRKARARYVEGKLELLDPLPLREDAEVLIETSEQPAENEGAGSSILRLFEELHGNMPDGAFDDLPTDGAMNYKQYLYGHPKGRGRVSLAFADSSS